MTIRGETSDPDPIDERIFAVTRRRRLRTGNQSQLALFAEAEE